MKKWITLTLFALTSVHAQTVQTLNQTLSTYGQIWQESLPEKRLPLMQKVLAADFDYVDDYGQSVGHQGLSDIITGMHNSYPGFTVEFGPVARHHNVARMAWAIYRNDKSLLVKGFDVVRFNEAGQLTSLIGFVGNFNTDALD